MRRKKTIERQDEREIVSISKSIYLQIEKKEK